MRSFLTNREKLLLVMEIKQHFLHRRCLHFVPLLLFGAFMTTWIYPVGSPFAPIVIVVVAGLELQFNNILFRSPTHLEAMSMFPFTWERIVLVKNLATILLVGIVSLITTMT